MSAAQIDNIRDENDPAGTIRKALSLKALPLLMIGVTALPAHAVTTYEEAQVVGVAPVYETVTQRVPIRECRDETVAYRRDAGRRSATGPLLGAIIGGALGNAVGHSNTNKKVGVAVGALLGGSIGADISRRHRAHGETVDYRTEEVCQTSYEERAEERLSGYDVRYVYGGATYQTRMPRDPGDTLRVRVRVSPAE